MSEGLKIDFFVEDRGHELLIRALTQRIAREAGKEIEIRVQSAAGGHGRVMQELGNYLKLIKKGAWETPDLLIVAIDANCSRFTVKKNEIENAMNSQMMSILVPACPDPHVERWYMADRNAFERIVGKAPSVKHKKSKKDYYKRILSTAVRQAGHPSTLGGLEFASDLAEAMDLYRAGKADRSLDAFINGLRQVLRR